MEEYAVKLPGIQKCTLDITLFFTLVRGLGIKEAAVLQNLMPDILEKHLAESEGTPLYTKLVRYYTAMAMARDLRRAG